MTLASLKTPIVYPEPDGSPMAESDPARDYLIYGVSSLRLYFQNRPDIYVFGNLWLSYEQGVPDAVVCPDVFVVFGVENRQRRSYRVWEENGKTPDWVLEVTSSNTHCKDELKKPSIYAQMGVREYFQYDPTEDYLNPPLKGRRLTRNGYEVITPNDTEDGMLSLSSQVLGLEMRLLPDSRMRFFNPQTGEYLRSPSESERERVQERQRADIERQRADLERQRASEEKQRAEREKQRADRLAARLRELGIDPNLLD